MSKPKTYVSLILDQSGSMCSTKEQAVQGYNEQVQQMKLNAKDQEIFCSLVTFNGEVFEHLWCEEASKLNESTSEDYLTEGATAMRDAIGYTVNKLLATTDSKDPNTAYLVVIISDGEENSSKHFSEPALKELIQSVQATKKWTFTYMGCDDEYLRKVAVATSIPLENMAKWSNATPSMAVRGMKAANRKLRSFYGARASGQTCSSNLYNADCGGGAADFTTEDNDEVAAPFLKNVDPTLNLHDSLAQNLNVHHGTHTSAAVNVFSNKTPVSWQG